ncbi:MAG: DUF2680 domain-containing protein [Bacillota bacterium]
MQRSHKTKTMIGLLSILLVLGLFTTGIAMATQGEAGKTGSTIVQKGGEIFLAKLATRLGVEQSKLKTDILDAQKQTLDQMVLDGLITQAQAEQMKQRLQKNPSHFMLPFMETHYKFMKGGKEDLAKALGMSPDELKVQLRSGKKLTEIAQAKGMTIEQLEQKFLELKKAHLTEAVKAGEITQQQATEIIDHLNQKKGFCRYQEIHDGKR